HRSLVRDLPRRMYARQPILLDSAKLALVKFLRELGLIRHITPVIDVAANSSCNAERLPWGELDGA
ncbi:MAG TPA: hypothetical protein VK678_04625, partial [Bradyrhizobium sp.]|nr:hypothetical protein [Bradyrhizobium sp.]